MQLYSWECRRSRSTTNERGTRGSQTRKLPYKRRGATRTATRERNGTGFTPCYFRVQSDSEAQRPLTATTTTPPYFRIPT